MYLLYCTILYCTLSLICYRAGIDLVLRANSAVEMLQVREGYLYVMYVMYLNYADGKVHVCVSCIKSYSLQNQIFVR